MSFVCIYICGSIKLDKGNTKGLEAKVEWTSVHRFCFHPRVSKELIKDVKTKIRHRKREEARRWSLEE